MKQLAFLIALVLAGCSSSECSQHDRRGCADPQVATTQTFSVEAELIDELVTAMRDKTALDKASYEADQRFYGVAAKLRARGLRYDSEGYSFRGEEHITRVYRVATEEVVEFYRAPGL